MDDVYFMRMAIREARKGIGHTSPNPAVGAVVVRNGKIVGRGYHRKAGSPHAEINALRNAGKKSNGATIFVTLEPCNHHGRTPPCTQAIIENGIQRVVVGMKDPNPKVAGGGNSYLVSQGIDVVSGILEEECQKINKPFVKYIQRGIPWVVLKAGLSLDGKIATHRGQSSWITCDKSRNYVHTLRNQLDGIMVGIDTVINDDPSLTTRLARGKGKDSIRVILDTHLRMPTNAKMLRQDSTADTLVYCGKEIDPSKKETLEKSGALVQPVNTGEDGHVDLKVVLRDLGQREVTSVLVEGGSKVHASFLQQKLADQVNLFFAPIFLGGDGISVASEFGLENVQDAYRLKRIQTRKFDDDVMIEGFF